MFADNVKKYRRKNQYTFDDLAAQIGVTRMTVMRWEHGQITKPSKLAEQKLVDLGIIPGKKACPTCGRVF